MPHLSTHFSHVIALSLCPFSPPPAALSPQARLEALRRDIEATYGHCPDDDEEGGSNYASEDDAYPPAAAAQVASGHHASSSSSGGSSGIGIGIGVGVGIGSSSSIDGGPPGSARAAPLPAPLQAPLQVPAPATSVQGGPPDPAELARLQEEKRSLHAYLKTYEREFQRTHGRQVMHNEDILPVAEEYRRYKDLKVRTPVQV